MSATKKPSVRRRRVSSTPKNPITGVHVDPKTAAILGGMVEEFQTGFVAIVTKTDPKLAEIVTGASSKALSDELQAYVETMAEKLLDNIVELQSIDPHLAEARSHSLLLTAIAENMEQSIAALGPALAEIETPVSPQLARSMAATERAWRDLETEFGLLSSREVSELVGSKSPNRSYASELRSKGKMIAVKRPGGLRYPGFQIDREEHAIRPVMENLIRVAEAAGRTEASLALWMTSRSGYLDGDRPVDQLSQPDKVVEAAEQSFGVQW